MRYTLIIAALFLAIVAYPSPRPADIEDLMAEWRESYNGTWWLWGLAAVDIDGDGRDELCVTQHNGGSRILRQTDSGWEWANVGNNLGGTFRPTVIGRDLLFRDSTPNTFYINVDGKYVNGAFGYGTGNDPIRVVTDFNNDGFGDVGHDWGRWLRNGNAFVYQPYCNPLYGKLPPNVKAELDGCLGKQFFRAWFHEHADIAVLSGHWSYGKGQSFCRFMRQRRGRLIESNQKLGLPTVGVVVHAGDLNFDGQPDYLISGAGQYLSGPQGYNRVGGPLSDFLSSYSDWSHECTFTPSMLAVSNIKGQTVKIFTPGAWAGMFVLADTIWSWNGECVTTGDFDGDGREDIAVGSGDSILFVWGK